MNSCNFLLTPFGPGEAFLINWFLTAKAKRWRALLKIYRSGQHNFQ
jgi:hypothetical protein